MAVPMLLPGLRRLWRDRHTLQLGVDPRRALLLEFRDPGTARMLDLLDGSHSDDDVARRAVRFGATPDDARALLRLLRAGGMAVPAERLRTDWLAEPLRRRLAGELAALALRGTDGPVPPAEALRRRRAASVDLAGHGHLVVPIARTLAAAGVGCLQVRAGGRVDPAEVTLHGLDPADTGRSRAEVIIESLRRSGAGTRVGSLRPGETTITVQVGPGRPAALDGLELRRNGPARLSVDTRDGTVIIGPLTRPSGSPCPYCLELHRRDRDPGWPAIAAQLATSADHDEPCAASTIMAAAAVASAEVLGYIDGDPIRTSDASIEISRPGLARRRTWPPHPDCGCRGFDPPGTPSGGGKVAGRGADPSAGVTIESRFTGGLQAQPVTMIG